YFYDLYAKTDLALSMRIHSMNPAVGIGTPVVPLLSHERMREFMRAAGLSDRCVEVLDSNLPERLYELASRALAQPDELRRRLAAAHDSLRDQTRAFNGRVAEFVRA